MTEGKAQSDQRAEAVAHERNGSVGRTSAARFEIARHALDVVAALRSIAQSVAAQTEKDDAVALGELGRRRPIPAAHVSDEQTVEHDDRRTLAELLDVQAYSVVG